MKKETYFQTLYKLLRKLPENDRQTTVAFYREIVEDRMENGLSEEAAVASLGDVHQLAQKILLENPQRRSSTKPAALRSSSPNDASCRRKRFCKNISHAAW